MAETYGRVVVQATAEVLQSFQLNRDKGLAQFVAYANADSEINDDCDVFFDLLSIHDDCGCFEFTGPYWPETAERLVATGEGFGLYLHSWSEYGKHFFLAFTPQGEKVSFIVGGPDDDLDQEGGDPMTPAKLAPWLALIPDSIAQAFPQLLPTLDTDS